MNYCSYSRRFRINLCSSTTSICTTGLAAVHNSEDMSYCASKACTLNSYPLSLCVRDNIDLLQTLKFCRSQWPRGLRHEPSSPTRTLGSWVPIPIESLMSACVFSVCVVLCVGSGLSSGWSPVQGVLLTVCRLRNLKSGQGPQGQ
jgi:hypothetical protein